MLRDEVGAESLAQRDGKIEAMRDRFVIREARARGLPIASALGGSFSAEHGIGRLKRDELARLGDPVSLAMMRAIKQALDPHNIMNPGKIFN